MAAEREKQQGKEPGKAASVSDFFETSPARAYFKAIEAAVIELRGAPLQFSPDDWQIAKVWYADGIPLDLVGEILQSVIDRRRKKEQEIPRRLSFYREAVEKAWQKTQGLRATAKRREAPEFGVEERLERLAGVLERALAARPCLSRLPAELRTLDTSEGLEAVEQCLAEMDQRLIQGALGSLDGAEVELIEARVRQARAVLEDRFPEPPSPAVEQRLRAEAVRRLLSLPVLSLFAPEAMSADSETTSSS